MTPLERMCLHCIGWVECFAPCAAAKDAMAELKALRAEIAELKQKELLNKENNE